MLRLTVNKSHSVTRYEVASTEWQTEDVLVEPFIVAALLPAKIWLCVLLCRCCPTPSEVFEMSLLRHLASDLTVAHLIWEHPDSCRLTFRVG